MEAEKPRGQEPITNGEKSDKDPITGRFLPGNNANPKGRPTGRFSLTARMIKRLEENPEETDAILDWLVRNKKDLIWNKIDPDPPTDLNIGGDARLPFTIIIERPDERPNDGKKS